MHERILDVYFFQHKTGLLLLNSKQEWAFQYDKKWLKSPSAIPLSLSLPLQDEAFDHIKSHAFFSNLLPENKIREAIAKNLGFSAQNDFKLLSAIGGECAGAVSLFPSGAKVNTSGEYRPLSPLQIQKLFETLSGRPFLAGEKNIRLSLAGAQNKLPVYIHQNQIYLAMGNYPSSHILKPPISDYPATIGNEVFCMKLAKAVGLPTANAEIYHKKITLYCTERFDRYYVDKKKKLLRLHQEDFCQALSVKPEYKYESEGGPTLNQCFEVLKKYSAQPILDQRKLLQWIIFNYLIGNADGHAKNIAILFAPEGPELAPFYDLFCTAIYEDLTSKLAMKIGGENRPQWIQERHWGKLAQDNNFNPKIISSLAHNILNKIFVASKNISQEILDILPEDKKYLDKIHQVIETRAQKISKWINL